MKQYQQDFIELAIAHGVLKFGEFELKSGRISPYFFNAGQFRTGGALATLGRCYAEAVQASGIEFDVLFGPAYKGIPLSAVTAAALASDFDRDIEYCFNRKEAKAHGEGGTLVGAELAGKRVLIIDDVITAGTAIRESIDIIKANNAEPVAVAIALDRQERGTGELSAIQEVEQEYGLEIVRIIGLNNLTQYLAQGDDADTLNRINAYRDQYGTNLT